MSDNTSVKLGGRDERGTHGFARRSTGSSEMTERAKAATGLDDGVRTDAPDAEESPYEKIFTGGDTVIAKPSPLRVNTPRVILAGIVLWAIFGVVTLLVPALHEGERDFWPWMCLAGIILGLLGYVYVRRGRGNAEAA